jgi:3-hydroxyisobutyrate dehydrogenase-like beta-hydroxyacid dehydrogenase
MLTVGFIGLGHMGGPVATRIQAAGFPMVVCDLQDDAVRPFLERGARRAASPALVASQVDVTFTAVPMPSDVETVAVGPGGILEGIREDGVYVDISTSSPLLVRRLEPGFLEKKAWVMDAPVGSGQPATRAPGVHEIMAGGDYAVFERVRPVFEAYGDQIIYAGDLGSGCVCKLVHQLIGSGFSQVIAEGLTLGVKAGVDLRIVWEAVRRGLAGRLHTLHEGVPATVFNGRYTEPSTFTLSLLRKDVGLATELARRLDVPMPVSSLVEQILIASVNRGWGGGSAYTVTFQLQEEAAGVQLRLPGIDAREAARYISTNPDTGYLTAPAILSTQTN